MAAISQTAFLLYFHESKVLDFDLNFTEVFSKGSNWQYVCIGSSNGFSPNRPLKMRHNEPDGVSNHQPLPFRRRSKKTSKLRVTGLYEGNSSVTNEFPAQMASNAENVPIWWRHDGNKPLPEPKLAKFIGAYMRH